MKSIDREVKHRRTCAPFECDHCGVIWYGGAASSHYTPDSLTLCAQCHIALDNYLDEKYDDFFYSLRDEHTEERMKLVHADAWAWIQNKHNKPYLVVAEKRFRRSVPKWMRSAINAGMVQPN